MTSNAPIFSKELIHSLAKSYNTLSYHVHLSDILMPLYPSSDLIEHTKFDLHRMASDTLIRHYNGEEILKCKLVKSFFQKSEFVGAYEVNVNDSRLDFLAINGFTESFEFKSALDNLRKLPRQVANYNNVFEYNHLIVDQRHLESVEKIIHPNWGLWEHRRHGYKVHKEAKLNKSIDPGAQLILLSKHERKKWFGEEHGDVQAILKNRSARNINKTFKAILKERYSLRWDFLRSHRRRILPIDLQFFFNNNIHPDVIYQR